MSTTATPERSVVLGDIDWQTYEALRGAPNNRNVRMTYDEGDLEIMSPSKLHERFAELLGRLIIAWTEENRLPVQGCGTTTFKRRQLGKALEPDRCYYIQHESQVRERDEVDLEIDPPPDLVIEIDVTSRSFHRLKIYAAIGVPEVWRYDGESLEVHRLTKQGRYTTRATSGCLPGFPIDEARRVLEQRNTSDDNTLVRRFREHVRRLSAKRSKGRA